MNTDLNIQKKMGNTCDCKGYPAVAHKPRLLYIQVLFCIFCSASIAGQKWECDFVNIRRGDIYYADLRPVVGSEQGGVRPVLIIQNDVGNRHSPTVICAAITSKMNKAKLPTHVEIEAGRYDIVKDSVILLEQLRTIDKKRLRDRVCHVDYELLERVDKALQVSLELYT